MDKTELEKRCRDRYCTHTAWKMCTHSAWKMLIVGIPGIYGDIGWECTQCGKVLQGLNPFKDQDALGDMVMQEMEV